MTEEYVTGLIVKKHKTDRTKDKQPVFKVLMTSLDKKIKLTVELPEAGRQVFHNYPIGEIIEITIGKASQATLDSFGDGNEEE